MIACFVMLAFAGVPSDAPKAGKPLPVSARKPTIDGAIGDWAGATLAAPPAASAISVKAAVVRDGPALVFGVTVNDEHVLNGDVVELTLYFPQTGPLSRGALLRLSPQGLLPSSGDTALPAFAQKRVQAASKVDVQKKQWSVEVLVPASALPRMQATGPLRISVCTEFRNVETEGGPVINTMTCPTGELPGGPVRLPDEFRRWLKLELPQSLESFEPRENGWVGFSDLAMPAWGWSPQPLTPATLPALMAPDDNVDFKNVGLALPRRLQIEGISLGAVLTGADPFAGESCSTGKELRLTLYALDKNTARRVLEWPASSCALGRAANIELTDEGGLVLGYTNGSTARFSWATDHFERSELGLRTAPLFPRWSMP